MGIKITRKRLERIVREALSKKEKKRRRKKAIMGFDSSEHIDDEYLSALGRGVIKDGCVGSAFHGKDGKFVDPDKEDGSYSLPKDKGCERKTGQYKRTGRKPGKNNEKCGRASKKRKLCKEEDGKVKDLYYRERLEALIRDTIKSELSKIKRPTNCTTKDLLVFMDRYSDAEKGKLGDKKKG
jgi:hypothetical protein